MVEALGFDCSNPIDMIKFMNLTQECIYLRIKMLIQNKKSDETQKLCQLNT